MSVHCKCQEQKTEKKSLKESGVRVKAGRSNTQRSRECGVESAWSVYKNAAATQSLLIVAKSSNKEKLEIWILERNLIFFLLKKQTCHPLSSYKACLQKTDVTKPPDLKGALFHF